MGPVVGSESEHHAAQVAAPGLVGLRRGDDLHREPDPEAGGFSSPAR